MQLDFTGLLSVLLFLTAASATVPPPENVTVSCRNLQTTVYWDYSNQQPQTSFRLNISGSAGYSVRLTKEHQYDLTHFVWESVERYMGFHFVQVTAVQGNQESKKVDSETFTFNFLKTADKQCQLDFPPVDVYVKDLEATVSFPNPYQVYQDLRQATLKEDGLVFDFHVTSDDREYVGVCQMKDAICSRDFPVLQSQEEYCVKLDGDIYDGNKFNRVVFKTTDICSHEGRDSHLIFFIVGLSVFCVIILVLVLVVCKVKAWIMSSAALPKSLASLFANSDMKVMNLPYESVSTASAVEMKRRQSSLTIVSEEEEEERPDETPTGCLYMDGGLSDSSNQETETEEVTSVSEDAFPEDAVMEDAVPEGLLGEEEEPSPYDRPHGVEVDMGQGDVVEGYCGR